MTKTEHSNFALWRHSLGPSEQISISAEDYKGISESARVIWEVRDWEEKFFVICENYRAMENFIFETTLHELLYHHPIQDIHLTGTGFGRFVLSLLSSTKLYLDTACTHLAIISNKALDSGVVNSTISEFYDSSFEYRVMHAIRNYAQHQALVVKSASYGASLNEELSKLKFSSDFFFEISALGSKKNFNKSVLKEIENFGEKVNLQQFTRSYFGVMCDIHSRFRKLADPYTAFHKERLERFRKLWIKKYPDKELRLAGVVAGRFKEGLADELIELVHMSRQADEFVALISGRTASLANMAKRSVVW